MRVGAYARISYGDEANEGLGVARQHQDCQALARLRGWEVVPYTDQDVSAYLPGVVRPDFERMLDDIMSGSIVGIVCYDLDRLCRKPTDLERVIGLYERRSGLLFATVQGDLQLATSDGRTLARVMVAFANKSSADTARRVSRQKLQRAQVGMVKSNYRPYGWRDDGTLEPSEAQILRDAASWILDGLGIFTVADRLNRQGATTVRGNSWRTSALRKVLTAPRLAGFAVFRGEVLLGEDGQPVKGDWEPLIDEATWRALQVALKPKATAQRRRKYLLSGIARCGACGVSMVGMFRTGKGPRYVCRSIDSGGCNRVSISMKLDEYVSELVLTYLDGHQTEPDAETFEGQARLNEVTAMLGELMEEYRQGLSGSIVFPLLRKLEDEQKELQAAKGSRRQLPSSTTREQWPDLDLPSRQAIIRQVVEAVVIAPVIHAQRFDPSRASVVWRQ